MNQYQLAMERAAERTRTHWGRAAAQTRAHFARHPECLREVVAVREDGQVIRGEALVNVERRCLPGWFDLVVRPRERRQPIIWHYWDEDAEHYSSVDMSARVAAWSEACQAAAKSQAEEARAQAARQLPLVGFVPARVPAGLALGV